jgi:hypothetical protein
MERKKRKEYSHGKTGIGMWINITFSFNSQVMFLAASRASWSKRNSYFTITLNMRNIPFTCAMWTQRQLCCYWKYIFLFRCMETTRTFVSNKNKKTKRNIDVYWNSVCVLWSEFLPKTVEQEKADDVMPIFGDSSANPVEQENIWF